MADSLFAEFETAALARPDLFSGIEYRAKWMAFRQLFERLIWGAIWTGQPSSFEEWKVSRVPREEFAALLEIKIPASERLNKCASVSIADAFEYLGEYYMAIRPALEAQTDHVVCAVSTVGCQVPGQLPPGFTDVTALHRALREAPESIVTTLVHGSLADGMVAGGFSDADVLCVIAPPKDGAPVFWSAAQWLFKLHHELFAINPCMHHGPMLAFAGEIRCAAEASLPRALLINGVVEKGGFDSVAYHDGLYEAVMALKPFEYYFEQHHLMVPDLENAFDTLWYISSVLILPVLLQQLHTGASIYKRDCLSNRRCPLSIRSWETIELVSNARVALGEWLERNRRFSPPPDRSQNPGITLQAHRVSLRLTPSELRILGIDDALFFAVRDLWQEVKSQTLAIGFSRSCLSAPRLHPVSWPRPVSLPKPVMDQGRYTAVREIFLSRCRGDHRVKAVFEFGEVGCPGLSDLDFCVVLDPQVSSIIEDLCVGAFSENDAYVIDHDPLFISADSCRFLSALFPIFHAQQLHGDPVSLPTSEFWSFETRAAAITFLSLQKYPGDLDWLLQQEILDVRRLLAQLHSAKHVEKCLTGIGVIPAPEITAAVKLDATIRDHYRGAGAIDHGLIYEVIRLCYAFAAATRQQLSEFWKRSQLHDLPSLHGSEFSIQENFLSVLLRRLSLGNLSVSPSAVQSAGLEEYMEAKRQLVNIENQCGRQPSRYIETPMTEHSPSGDLCCLANLAEMQSPAFTELMLEINSFAHSHGLREFSTWSKIWEYPWIWIHGISSVSLKGRTVVDLGSEISPMPWIIALRGAKVHLVETDPQWRPVWEKLRFKLGVDVEWHIVDSEKLPLPDASCDLVTSFSVIEHQRDKFRAVAEVVRVLKPDGKFALSYDICETEMGMSFPEWNGRALALAEFTKLVWLHPAWAIDAVPEWNTGNILPFLEWHRTTAPHHNYIVGAACLTKKNAAKPGPSPIVFGGGWHAHEAAGKDWWRWASSSASVFVRLTPGTEAILSGEILSRAKTDRVHVTLDGREIAVYDTNASEFVPFTLPHFAVTCLIHHLIFQCDSQALIEGVDPRPLGFAIRNFSVYPAPEYIRL